MNKINPKVTASAIGGAGGGATLATFTVWCLQSHWGMGSDELTPERIIAITSAWGFLCAFASGWLKKHGVEIDISASIEAPKGPNAV